jgi:polyprenyl-phospho-N-acetylgalactosaminyl synthase
VIPAFNEGPAIRRVVDQLIDAGWRVLVVDDGSRDDTGAVAAAAGAKVLRHVINRGQGAALQTGVDFALRCDARYIVTFDADGQHDVADLPALVGALADAEVALGSRFLGKTEGATRRRRAMLRLATRVSNRLAGIRLSDAHCGLRAFRATAAPALRIRADRMAHASELLRNIRVNRLRYVEVPVTIRYTEYSMRKGQIGIHAFRILFDYLFRA